jgi:hypothetical protein
VRKKGPTVKTPHPAQATAEAGAAGRGDHAGNRKSVPAEEIRLRAYQIWEAAGRPGGDGVNFWLEAERELSQAR